MKIAITGAHSTGKSRFIKRLKEYFLRQGIQCLDLHHTPEGCPYPIEMSQSIEATAWIVLKAMMKEVEALKSSTVLLLDRSVLDAWAYHLYWKNVKNSDSNQVLEDSLYHIVKTWMMTYDIVIKTKINETMEPKAKNIEHDNKTYRKGIEKNINIFLAENKIQNLICLEYGCAEEVIKKLTSLIDDKWSGIESIQNPSPAILYSQC